MSVAMQDWLQLLLPAAKGLIGVIKAYFDDTGTHPESPIVGFGGLFADEEAWAEFDAKWKAKLRAPLPGKRPLKRFHMADCMVREGEFQGYSEPEREAVIHDFRQIIIECEIWGYAMLASRPDWEDVMPKEYQQIIGDAEAYCFRDAVGRMIRFMDVHSTDTELSLVFDNQPQPGKVERNEAIFRQFQGLPIRTQLVGISFLENIKFTPLQGADIWAWEVFNQASDSMKEGRSVDPRPHARQYHDCGRFESYYCDKTSIFRMAETLSWVLPLGGKPVRNLPGLPTRRARELPQ
jgi:hypothetical protein